MMNPVHRLAAPRLVVALVAGFVLAGCAGHGAKTFHPVEMEDLTPAEGFGYRLGPFEVPSGEQVQD